MTQQMKQKRLGHRSMATPGAREPMRLLLNNPSFFPLQLPMTTGDLTAQRSERIDVVHCGLDDKLLKLNDRRPNR